MPEPLVAVVMGSTSDWETMRHAVETLESLGVPAEARVLSAHRTPDEVIEYAAAAEGRGLRAVIAGAGMAAALPGVIAAKTTVPVLGVPMEGKLLGGLDALLAIVQMPGGIPVATFAVGKAGAVNAALFAVSIVAAGDTGVAARLKAFRADQAAKVMENTNPLA